MRKAFCMIAMLFCLALYASHKQNPSHEKEGNAKPSEVATAPNDKPKTPEETPERKQEVGWIDRLLTWPEGVGAVAVILTLGAIIWQSDETRKSANAAARNIELIKTKERAKLLIAVRHKDFGKNDIPFVEFQVFNVGESKAFTGLAVGGIYFSASEKLDGSGDGYYELKISDSAMNANEKSWEKVHWPGHPLDRYTEEMANEGILTHLHGVITFRDVFEDQWSRRFHYIWRDYGATIYFAGRGNVDGFWESQMEERDQKIQSHHQPGKAKIAGKKFVRWLEELAKDDTELSESHREPPLV